MRSIVWRCNGRWVGKSGHLATALLVTITLLLPPLLRPLLRPLHLPPRLVTSDRCRRSPAERASDRSKHNGHRAVLYRPRTSIVVCRLVRVCSYGYGVCVWCVVLYRTLYRILNLLLNQMMERNGVQIFCSSLRSQPGERREIIYCSREI